MMHYRFSILLAVCVTCTGFTTQSRTLSSLFSRLSIASLSGLAQAQSADTAEFLEDSNYDSLMQAGYQATKQREYQSALEYFQAALAERPGDFYASAAIRNVKEYLSRNAEAEAAQVSEPSLWIVLSAAAIATGVAGMLFFFWTLRRTKSDEYSLPDRSPELESSAANPSDSDPKPHQDQQDTRFWEAESRPSDEATASETDFSPKQQTTRLADFDLFDELIKELYHPNLTKRRRAIQELGQSGDSRAVMPLIERIIDSDAYEHSLILETLTQISARVLQPMNQALSAALEDESPQVRRNAIRDLTQLYNLMSQVNQLLSHAADDSDVEVQQTAQWALHRLNLMKLFSDAET